MSTLDTPIDRVFPRLTGLRKAGDGWSARCPAHDDRRASLSVDVGDAGNLLLRCHAGCGNDAIVAAIGLSLADLFPRRRSKCRAASTATRPKPARSTKPARANGKTWATPATFAEHFARAERGAVGGLWIYTSADGVPALAVVRVNLPDGSKAFRPLHATAGGWCVGDPTGQLPLFKLPDVQAAVAGGGRVFIVEGEKCADALAAIGFVATTSAHGARSAAKTDLAPLAGADVRILPDRDAPGERYAADAAGLLAALDPPASVRVLRLPDLGDHGDVVDFIAARRAAGLDDRAIAAEIDRLAEAAPELASPTAADPPHGGNGDATTLNYDDADDVDAPALIRLADVTAEPVRWLWPGRFALGKLSLIAGDPSLGKSTVTLDMAARVSTGAGWPDAPAERFEPAGVVLLSAEDDLADTIRPRLDAAGANCSRIIALTAIKHRDARTGELRERGFDLTADLPQLERAIAACDACRLVVVDPVSAYMGAADSHCNADVRSVLAPLSALAAKHGVAVVAVTHLRKGEGPALYRAMGSLAFIAAARAAWVVSRDKADPAGPRRLFLPAKNNLAPDGGGLSYELRTADNGQPCVAWSADPVSVTADEALAPPPARPGPAAEDRDAAVAWLRAALAGGPRPAAELVEEARESEGISARTLRRARKAAGVEAYRPTNPGAWWWRIAGPATTEPDSGDGEGGLY